MWPWAGTIIADIRLYSCGTVLLIYLASLLVVSYVLVDLLNVFFLNDISVIFLQTTALCSGDVCPRGGGSSLSPTDSGVSGAAASLRPVDRGQRGSLWCWEGDQGEIKRVNLNQDQNLNRSSVQLMADGSTWFQTREQLLKDISHYQTRIKDLESALKQQGLVKHTHTHTQNSTFA